MDEVTNEVAVYLWVRVGVCDAIVGVLDGSTLVCCGRGG